MKLLTQGRTVTHYAPFISDSDLAAMRWLMEHTKVSDTIFAPPTFALFAPAFTGHQVYYGHWSETPDYAMKLNDWIGFIDPDSTDEFRMMILNAAGAGYVAGLPECKYSFLKQVGPEVYKKNLQKVQ